MSRITPVSAKKRKLEDASRKRTSKPRKQFKKQKFYHSSSEEDENDGSFAPVDLAASENERPSRRVSPKSLGVTATDAPAIVTERRVKPNKRIPASKVEDGLQADNNENDDVKGAVDSELVDTSLIESNGVAEDSETDREDTSGSASDEDAMKQKIKSKRNDPEAFSTSISKILGTKLPTSARSDPLLSRSKEAVLKATEANTAKLDRKAVARLRAEKLAANSKGRITDVLGIERGIAGEVAEEEKQLRKVALKGVVQLFNAFQAAHVRAEQTRREERQKGSIGMDTREQRAQEDSKGAFLQMIRGEKPGVQG